MGRLSLYLVKKATLLYTRRNEYLRFCHMIYISAFVGTKNPGILKFSGFFRILLKKDTSYDVVAGCVILPLMRSA